jgi:nucleoside-diphosphate-sugar epimerase
LLPSRVLLSNASPQRSLAEIPRAEAALARILVTGAAGFIGRPLCRLLVERGHAVLGVTRRPAEAIAGSEFVAIGDIGAQTEWAAWLGRIDVVVHLAGRAHRRMPAAAQASEPAAAAALVRAAAGCGVRRLVLMSSVKAMAETSPPDAPLRAEDRARPQTRYGRTKLAIEQAVAQAAQRTPLEIAVIRPPLVYGPGVRANFRTLIRLVAAGVPLPLAAIANRRSLVFVDDLARLTAIAAEHPAAAGPVLLARGAADPSTPELVSAIAAALGHRARLFAVPDAALAMACRLPLIGPSLVSLTATLAIDDRATRRALGWTPSVSLEAGLHATIDAFRRAG